jgi:hypothetical protein
MYIGHYEACHAEWMVTSIWLVALQCTAHELHYFNYLFNSALSPEDGEAEASGFERASAAIHSMIWQSHAHAHIIELSLWINAPA